MDQYKTAGASRLVAEVILTAVEFGRPMMATGPPADRLKILRDAYAKAMAGSHVRRSAPEARH